MPIRAVIFDVGGVLVRGVDPTGARAWEARLGLQPGEMARLIFESGVDRRALVGQATEEEVWLELGSSLGVPPEDCAGMGRDFWGGWEVDHDMLAFARELRPHYRTAILSNAWPGIRRIHEEETHLDREVDLMVFSCEVGIAKPDPGIYTHTAGQLGVRPDEAVFIDDVPAYVEGARLVGMRAVLFSNTEQAIAEVRAMLREDQGNAARG